MIDADLDDRHLCIKCNATILGLEAYIEHRKTPCTNLNSTAVRSSKTDQVSPNAITHTDIITTPRANHLEHTYDAFVEFAEPETYVKEPPTHGGKSAKSLSDCYDLPYELDADVFFSSLQLQSVQAATPSTSGKQGPTMTTSLTQQQRQVKVAHNEPWMSDAHGGGTSSAHQPKSYEDFEHESPEASEDEDEEDNDVDIDDDDDEDYDPIADAHASGGKWKPPTMRHSPPVVPETHTGGKWRPENRPTLNVAHTQLLTRLSPNWAEADEAAAYNELAEGAEGAEVTEAGEEQHPPAEHTKGKWIPGTKMQRLEYKEDVLELAKTANQGYWCNICCRQLKSKTNYENHLKTGYHLKRAEPERQLEKAALDDFQRGELMKSFLFEEFELMERPKPQVVVEAVEKTTMTTTTTTMPSGAVETSLSVADVAMEVDPSVASPTKKRHRRAAYIKCELCKHSMLRHLVGKHLISHYHYRRMQADPAKSLHMILENIHSVVLQSPFQCRLCCFYSNTEEMFLQHWSSAEHLNTIERLGELVQLWCSYCRFECEHNQQMADHLLSIEHKEVIWAINRSVPICISKKPNLDCIHCGQNFRYNAELRQHMLLCHSEQELIGTISDNYQCRFKCELCPEVCRSKVTLQRHEKNEHKVSKYFCSICNLEFDTPGKARRHRKTAEHRKHASTKLEKGREANVKNSRKKRMTLERKQFKGEKSYDEHEFMASSDVEAILNELTQPDTESLGEIMKVEEIATNTTEYSKPSAKSPAQRSQQKNEQKVIKCRDCEEIFASKTALSEHRDICHPLLRHVCLSCGESFALAQALGRHARLCEPKPSTSKEAMLLEVEANVVRGANKWSCEECDFSAPYESELIFHRLYHLYGPMSKNQIIACPICSKDFRKLSLRCHLRCHTNEKIFACEYCDMKFARRHNLKDHIKRIHEVALLLPDDLEEFSVYDAETTEKVKRKRKMDDADADGYTCDVCSKTFVSHYMLKKHTASQHTANALPDSRGNACNYQGCKYVASNSTMLRIHGASHAQEQLKCSEPTCEYVGKSLLHLKRHSRSHQEPSKLYSCDECDFKARIKGHIKRHMLTHTGEKPYACPHCDFRCNTFDNLRKHVLKTGIHPGKFIYECQQCKDAEEEIEIFKTNSYKELRKHNAEVHGEKK